MDFMSVFKGTPSTPPRSQRLLPTLETGGAPTPSTTPRQIATPIDPETQHCTAFGRRPKTPVAEHARAFVAWMADSAYGIEGIPDEEIGVWQWIERDGNLYAEMLQSDLLGAYSDMCAEQDLQPHAWNTLARELREFLGEHKRYARVPDEHGVIKRRRCYHIPIERRERLPYPEPRVPAREPFLEIEPIQHDRIAA